MIYKMMLHQSPCYINRAPMGIHMIGTILCIVLQDENDTLLPYRAFTKVFYEFTHGEVIIRHMGKRSGPPLLKAFRMIVAQTYRIQPGQGACSQERIKIPFPLTDPYRIPYLQVPTGIGWTKMPLQYGNIGLTVICKFAIGPVIDSGSLAMIPDETAFVIRYGPVAFSIVSPPSSPIAGNPVLFQVVISISAHTPIMSIHADLRIHIKIIQQGDFFIQSFLFTNTPLPK